MKALIIVFLLWFFMDLSTPTSTVPLVTGLVGTTENASAREDFQRGLLLLHNFEYLDAADLFREAQKKDPTFALAYWGEAMTYNHPVWLSQETDEARETLREYKEHAGPNGRPLPSLDRDLLTSVEILYGDGTKRERDAAYADFMASLYQKYRANEDVAAFYSLSLLGKAAGWDEALCNEAAGIARAILEENPKHAGALHYYIHAQDHPLYAKHAWNQANSYSKVASYSGHALHMPSHIYLALGLWDEVVRSNEVSWQAGVDRKESRKLTNNAHNYHAHWWLTYGYLQQGRFSKAEERLRNQLAFTRELPSPVARTHFVTMRGHFLAETNDWRNSILGEDIKTADLRIEIRNLDRFVNALSAFRSGDANALAMITRTVQTDVSSARQGMIINSGVAQCAGDGPSAGGVSNTGLNQAAILLEELKALSAYLGKDFKTAEAHLQRAIAIEEENGHFFGPPEILKPTHEFYGDFLLARGRNAEAAEAFDKALAKAPGRNQSLFGLSQALAATGDKKRHETVRKALERNLASAERTDITGIFPP